MSTTMQATAPTETRCWGADFMWDQDKAEAFRKMCRDALGRDCFCVQGEPCWLAQTALDELKALVGVEQAEVVGNFQALGPAGKQQILGYAWQLQAEQHEEQTASRRT